MNDNRFFAASNGGDGFFSMFGDKFSPEKFDTVYIIKGGPGTGKSTFMKKFGEEAERRGYTPDYFFCSSDPSSLDGVSVKEVGVCVVDGTSPHVTEARYPGACERILNFCDAFDVSALKNEREKIEKLTRENSGMYTRAYASLRAAKEAKTEQLRVIRSAYLEKKAGAFIGRKTAALSRGAKDEAGICTAGGGGVIRLPVFFERAKRVILVEKGVGHIFLSNLEKAATGAGVCMTVSRDPICREYTESIYFEKDGLYIAVDRSDYDGVAKHLNVQRFFDKEKMRSIRRYVRQLEKICSLSEELASSCLNEAAEIHKKIESIYIANTDFKKIDKIYSDVINCVFSDK